MLYATESLRRTFAVSKFELFRYSKGRNVLIMAAFMGIMLFALTVLPFATGKNYADGNAASMMFSFPAQVLCITMATLFAAPSLVSDFEGRASFILFTKPISRESVFLGKFLAALVTGWVMTAIYFTASFLLVAGLTGEFVTDMFRSMFASMSYVFASAGLAMFFSSFSKRASTASILSFAVPLIMFTIISTILVMNDVETWFMLDTAADLIHSVLPGFWDQTYQMFLNIGVPPDQAVIKADAYIESLKPWRAASVMFAWGVAGSVSALLVYRKRAV